MDPIQNLQFSHDYHRFVLQDTNPKGVNPTPIIPFTIKRAKKSEKTKKDIKKNKEQEKENLKDLFRF